MSKRKIARRWTAMVFMAVGITGLAGCAGSETEGKVEVELVSYKPEAVEAFEKIQDRFNETHQDIHLTIDSPNEAMTIA